MCVFFLKLFIIFIIIFDLPFVVTISMTDRNIKNLASYKCDYGLGLDEFCETLPVTKTQSFYWVFFSMFKHCVGCDLLTYYLLVLIVLYVWQKILMNDWLPRCADLLDTMMDKWKNLVPMKSKDGGRAAILFRCIHSLMSRQVQTLIKRSIDHLYNALIIYKVNHHL